jgi:hypothetical protein
MADTLGGQAVRCPACNKKFRVDDEEEASPPLKSPVVRMVLIGVGGVIVIALIWAVSVLLFESSKAMEKSNKERLAPYEEKFK